MKRLIAVLLSLTLLCGTCAFSASALWFCKDQPAEEPVFEKIDTEYPFVLVRGMDFGGLLFLRGG